MMDNNLIQGIKDKDTPKARNPIEAKAIISQELNYRN